MAIDSTLPVRKAILTALKNNPSLNEILPAAHIYTTVTPPSPPWPFAWYENIGPTAPIVATCLDGQELNIRIHVHAKSRTIAGLTVETAEDHTCRIMSRVSTALDRRRFTIDRGHIYLSWRGSLVRMDGDETDAFQGVVNMRIRAMTV